MLRVQSPSHGSSTLGRNGAAPPCDVAGVYTGSPKVRISPTLEAWTKQRLGQVVFWGVEETFRAIPGVSKTSVGYMGGSLNNPTYQDVCTDRTGHAEVVQVEYDPAQVSYDDLLNVFWANHDPTTKNRQGPDFGTQYRSVIFYHSPEQAAAARASKERQEKSGSFHRPIVTLIEPAAGYWLAEDYHQQYLAKRGLSHCGI